MKRVKHEWIIQFSLAVVGIRVLMLPKAVWSRKDLGSETETGHENQRARFKDEEKPIP
jgi:hypothetical protein